MLMALSSQAQQVCLAKTTSLERSGNCQKCRVPKRILCMQQSGVTACLHRFSVHEPLESAYSQKQAYPAGRSSSRAPIFHDTVQRSGSARKGKQLLRCLDRLRPLLAALPRNRRRQIIEGLSEHVRRWLLFRMQAAARAIPTSNKSPSGSLHTTANPIDRAGLASQIPLITPAAKPNHNKTGFCKNNCYRSQPRHGGVSTVRLGGAKIYFARITIDGIVISSRGTPSLREAERLRGCLAGLANARPKYVPGNSKDVDEEWLQNAFLGFLSPRNGTRSEIALLNQTRWSFRVLVDARAWVGQILSTRQLHSIAAALQWRSRVREARRQGWRALRLILQSFAPKSHCRDRQFGETFDPGTILKENEQYSAAEEATGKSCVQTRPVTTQFPKTCAQSDKIPREFEKLAKQQTMPYSCSVNGPIEGRIDPLGWVQSLDTKFAEFQQIRCIKMLERTARKRNKALRRVEGRVNNLVARLEQL